MDIFDLRDKVVNQYNQYVQGFINIKDDRIKTKVEERIESGLLCPDPIIQLNPSYEEGESIETLVKEGILHEDCAKIFSFNGVSLNFYKHQTEAIRRAVNGEDYVLTTGTGSGKSLTYIVPIINQILRDGTGQGVRAIIVYPMNALANSQLGELDKFLPNGSPFREKIKFKRYTGQEDLEEKNNIRNNPPDLILTNYMMLELLLTRSSDASLVEKMKNLKFFVLDELHNYRGRQGADVAMLARRTLQATAGAPENVICVGTSATIASGKSRDENNAAVASVASQIFGKVFKPENIVGESLCRETEEYDFSDEKERETLRREVDLFKGENSQNFEKRLCELFKTATPLDALRQSRLTSWIESNFGIKKDETGQFVRQTPKPISGKDGGAAILAEITGRTIEDCARAIQTLFLYGANVNVNPRRVFLPFKIHQFVSRGENAYVTVELPEKREIFLTKQIFAPGAERKKLFPVVFCAECGQEYYSVKRVPNDDEDNSQDFPTFEAREPFSSVAVDKDEKENLGYLLIHGDQSKSEDEVEKEYLGVCPEDWKNGDMLDNSLRKEFPCFYRVNPHGEAVRETEDGVNVSFVHSPFRFCPVCGAAYEPKSASSTRSDASRLTSLSVGGRSSSTTVLALATEKKLLELFPDVPGQSNEENLKNRKFLSFTDNRQDASLQSGHLNDFVRNTVLRAALVKALRDAGENGLNYGGDPPVEVAVFNALKLDPKDYDIKGDPDIDGSDLKKLNNAFKWIIKYRLMCDLRRGWRDLLPNLEQTGLLKIDYEDADRIARNAENWKDAHDALRSASPEIREDLIRTLLDLLRNELAIQAPELDVEEQAPKISFVQKLVAPKWGFDETENDKTLYHYKTAYLCTKKAFEEDSGTKRAKKFSGDACFITSASLFGRYVKRVLKDDELTPNEIKVVIEDLFRVCESKRLLNKVDTKRVGFQINPGKILWKLGDGTPAVDKLRRKDKSFRAGSVNQYFKKLYEGDDTLKLRQFHAKEHTAQVPSKQREEREEEFKKGVLPILFCSPTMELGVDISELNVVHMRNIPPTPANYAQRSGRAGRGGQPALSIVYATPLSQHDRYYFNRPSQVVAGAVAPPQIDLDNKALILSHLHAIWLSVAASKKLNNFSLGGSMKEIVDLPDLEDDVDSPAAKKEERRCAVKD